MTRDVKLVLLKPLMDQFYPEDDTWPQRSQALAVGLSGLLSNLDTLTDGQFAALVSLAESLGANALVGSTILRLINAGNMAMATYEFEKFVYGPDPVSGQPTVLPALVNRRQQEKAVWLS